MTSAFSPMPAATPSGPSTTECTAIGSASIMTTASAPRAASAGDAASRAPASTSGCARPGERFHTASAWPRARMFAAIGAPMVPSPRNATFIARSASVMRAIYPMSRHVLR